MSKFTLAFGIHNHQPVGNFDFIFEESHQKAYLPFLKLVQEFPWFRMSLHQSGILWRWQKERHPDYFDLVRDLISRGQIDLLTGGFYEPILPSIPERDVRGQISMLTRFLKEQFGVEAPGSWLTERIWEPHLPKVLAESGVKFLPVDDTHFIYAGFDQSQLTGPFITENEGHTVTLLPIQKRLRYLIPFAKVEDVIAELKRQAELDPNGMAVYADDGEKFGGWPDTYKHCYEDKWLIHLFEALERNSDWLQISTLTEASNRTPVGRAYLPTASYEEMLHWALPTKAFVAYDEFEHWLKAEAKWESYGRFVRGGHWRGFLAKYDEVNLMHKKMLWVSDQIQALAEKYPQKEAEIESARDRLYASQCNCPYWHGVFGGLYLPHIRQAIYQAMIEASRMCFELSPPNKAVRELDYDADGRPEVMFQSKKMTAVIRPHRGGALLSWSLNEQGFELTDTLSRRREGYHNKLKDAIAPNSPSTTASIHDQVRAKEAGLEKFLVEDWYLKRALVDHFLDPTSTIESLASNSFTELGDFILEPYEYELSEHLITMKRDGHVRTTKGGVVPVRITKTIGVGTDAEQLDVEYQIQSLSGDEIDIAFAVENNFSFQAGHAEDRFVVIDGIRPQHSFLDSTGSHPSSRVIGMIDKWRDLAVAVGADRSAEIWHLPIFTVSLSEGGFERVYQGTTLVHKFNVRLGRQPLRIGFTLDAGRVEKVVQAWETQASSTVR